MPDVAPDLDHQLAAEDRTKLRQYVLSTTRGRWKVLGLGVLLLTAIRLAGLVPLAWSFVLGFTVVFAVVNYAMARIARSDELPPWYLHATMPVGAATISPIVRAVVGRASRRARVPRREREPDGRRDRRHRAAGAAPGSGARRHGAAAVGVGAPAAGRIAGDLDDHAGPHARRRAAARAARARAGRLRGGRRRRVPAARPCPGCGASNRRRGAAGAPPRSGDRPGQRAARVAGGPPRPSVAGGRHARP